MIDQLVDTTAVDANANDLVACHLLKNIDRYEQFAILYCIDTLILKRVFIAAAGLEEYEICQVIKELLEERTMMAGISSRKAC